MILNRDDYSKPKPMKIWGAQCDLKYTSRYFGLMVCCGGGFSKITGMLRSNMTVLPNSIGSVREYIIRKKNKFKTVHVKWLQINNIMIMI